MRVRQACCNMNCTLACWAWNRKTLLPGVVFNYFGRRYKFWPAKDWALIGKWRETSSVKFNLPFSSIWHFKIILPAITEKCSAFWPFGTLPVWAQPVFYPLIMHNMLRLTSLITIIILQISGIEHSNVMFHLGTGGMST